MRAAARTASRIPAPAGVQSVSSKTVSAAVTVSRIRATAVESAGSRPVKTASAAQSVARPAAVAARLATRPTVCAARAARNPAARSVAEDV